MQGSYDLFGNRRLWFGHELWSLAMPVHDWTRASAGVFHAFHVSWIGELQKALNSRILPDGYYALAEQVAGKAAVADEAEVYALKRRTLVIRHTSGDEVIALLEILSPGNKSHKGALQRFLDKAVSALTSNVHLLIVDLHPPGPHDPQGIHGAFWSEFGSTSSIPDDKPLTLAAYSAGTVPRAYLEPTAVGSALPHMPLFLEEDRYLDVPLEATYREAYRGLPDRWQAVLEGREARSGPAV